MLNHIKQQIQKYLECMLVGLYPPGVEIPSITLDVPADKDHGDLSCNIALKSAKILKKKPLDIAENIADLIKKDIKRSELSSVLGRIEVKAPGFINFFLTEGSLSDMLSQVLISDENYGRVDMGHSEKINLEFVSANPTGPLSVAHARQAVVGDVLGNVLKFLGFEVTKEYYVNDGGNQIKLLGESIKARASEIFGKQASIPENGYEGEYVKDIAQQIIDEQSIKDIDQVHNDVWRIEGVAKIMKLIEEDLSDFNVHFDVWSREAEIAHPEAIVQLIDELKNKGFVYEHEGALWFKSTAFGDDKDRVVKKSDGSFTYLAPDIVYHKDKFDRTSRVVNIWGPDHHGYIPRISAAAQALGKDAQAITVLIVQLASIFRDGKPLSMSTRKGQFISLREVIDEVGTDAARFFFLMRHISAHLEFDLDLAKKQTSENPVYYIQYAHARVFSINSKAEEVGIKIAQSNFDLLSAPEETELIKRLGAFQDSLYFCYHQMDPYPLVSYMNDVAALFHKFYDRCRIMDVEPELASQRLALANASRIVIRNGLILLGLEQPEKM